MSAIHGLIAERRRRDAVPTWPEMKDAVLRDAAAGKLGTDGQRGAAAGAIIGACGTVPDWMAHRWVEEAAQKGVISPHGYTAHHDQPR